MFGTWLRTLVKRQIANYYRSKSPDDAPLEGSSDDCEGEPVYRALMMDNTTTVDNCIVVREALKKLPERYQEVILLRFAEDLPFQEIACLLGQSLEATKSLFRRAIAALQRQLEEVNA